MQRNFQWVLAIVAAFTLVAANSATAQDIKVQAPGVKVEGSFATRATGTHRASKLIGAEVKNSEGTSLGKVDDLIMDEKGNARYMVLAHGGVLGVGQKYFAVPFGSVAIRHKDEYDARWVELDVNPKTLEKAPSFTSDKWPNFTNVDSMKETDTFFHDVPRINVRVNTNK